MGEVKTKPELIEGEDGTFLFLVVPRNRKVPPAMASG